MGSMPSTKKNEAGVLLFVILIVLNLMMTVHISHNLCFIMHMFWDNDIVLLPGGEQSFCNDFCVNLCVNGSDDFQCEITNCLNNCNLHFGNEEMVPPKDYVAYKGEEAPVPPMRGDGPPPVRDYAPS